ncbi:MAG: hypothetical protein GF398_03350 [Chitinivibrionales bacterium]|nr:hypothetical protein [Chitinivibrionales bacterium]
MNAHRLRHALSSILLLAMACTCIVGATPNVRIASSQDIEQFFGTRKVKAAFTDAEHRLHYVDFSDQTPLAHALDNAPQCSNPAMSPDGEWIAFSSGSLGDGRSSEPATAWIIRTDPDAQPIRVSDSGKGWTPRFLQSGDVPTVVWATCGTHSDPDKHAWEGCGAMLQRACPNGVPGTVDTLFSGGSYFGGASYSGQYLSSAEYRKKGFIKEVSSPLNKPAIAVHHLTCEDQEGKDSTFALQVCNPSSSQSRRHENTFMFLDFGFSPQFNGFAVCDPDFGEWFFHEIVFVINDKDEIVKKYRIAPAPSDADTGMPSSAEWAHSEWSTHPYYAVASEFIVRKWPHPTIPILEPSKKIEHITAINLKDSVDLRLVSTADTTKEIHRGFYFGALYVDVPDNFVEECWLADSCANVEVEHNMKLERAARISIEGNSIVCDKTIRKVGLYLPNGSLLMNLTPVDGIARFDRSALPAALVLFIADRNDGSRVAVRRCIAGRR